MGSLGLRDLSGILGFLGALARLCKKMGLLGQRSVGFFFFFFWGGVDFLFFYGLGFIYRGLGRRGLGFRVWGSGL